jgi:hypothetical protein
VNEGARAPSFTAQTSHSYNTLKQYTLLHSPHSRQHTSHHIKISTRSAEILQEQADFLRVAAKDSGTETKFRKI